MDTNTNTEMTKAGYNELMEKIAEGGKVSRKTFDELTEFAKAKKIKRPPAEAVLDTAGIKQAKVATDKPAKAKKEPKPKEKCSVTKGEGKGQDPKMATKTCPNDSRAGGMCATHYSRLIYRAKPENAEKARQASRNYAAKQRALKAEQKKQVESAA